jgi:pimeloyl-ACP methyl ester carboxylesterase
MKPFVDTYGYALLIMVTPRNCGPYPDYMMEANAMSRWVMFPNPFDKPEYQFYKRPDLEFIKVIDDFMNFLKENGYTPYAKVFMTGFSAGGQQSNKFPILHPSRIAATAIGAPAFFTYPVEIWERIPLTYPVGTYDINQIPGTTYSLAAFKQIPRFIFVGRDDTKDPGGVPVLYDQWQAYIINTYFSKNPVERAIKFADYLKSIGMQAQLKVYPGVGHEYTSQMIIDTFNFFDSIPTQ